jgi:uncharacterized protein YeaO (DUF488 family)
LAGFTKKDDLRFFLKDLCNADYLHETLLAPTDEILDAYKKKEIDWKTYEVAFNKLIEDRKVEEKISKSVFDIPSVLLCSEATADKCHRRLVAEYLAEKWGSVNIRHV